MQRGETHARQASRPSWTLPYLHWGEALSLTTDAQDFQITPKKNPTSACEMPRCPTPPTLFVPLSKFCGAKVGQTADHVFSCSRPQLPTCGAASTWMILRMPPARTACLRFTTVPRSPLLLLTRRSNLDFARDRPRQVGRPFCYSRVPPQKEF